MAGRLVSLFAEDARALGLRVFHLYYVFALDAAHGFLISARSRLLRTSPVSRP